MGWAHFVVAVSLAGCGRLYFDDITGGNQSTIDGTIDGTGARTDICAPTLLKDLAPSLGPGERPIEVRVTPTPLGQFGVEIGTSALNVFALHLSSMFVAEATPHLPLPGSTTLFSATSTTADVFAWIGDGDGTAYLKRLNGNWDSFSVSQHLNGRFPADPALADWQNVVDEEWLLGGIDNTGHLAMFGVLSDGSTGLWGPVNYHPAATSVSMVTLSGSLSGVAVALGGACESFIIDAANNLSTPHSFAPPGACNTPFIAVGPSDPGFVVYENANQVYAHRIPSNPSLPGATIALGDGIAPRLIVDGTRYWVVWRTNGMLAVGDLDPNLIGARATVAATSHDVTTFGGRPHVLWLAGTELWDGQPCLP